MIYAGRFAVSWAPEPVSSAAFPARNWRFACEAIITRATRAIYPSFVQMDSSLGSRIWLDGRRTSVHHQAVFEASVIELCRW